MLCIQPLDQVELKDGIWKKDGELRCDLRDPVPEKAHLGVDADTHELETANRPL